VRVDGRGHLYLKDLVKEFWVEDEDLERMKKYLTEDLQHYKKLSKEKYLGMDKDGEKVGRYMDELVLHVLKANTLIELWEELMFPPTRT
jgi:hypothetical protein